MAPETRTSAIERDRAHLMHPLHHPSAYATTRVWVSGRAPSSRTTRTGVHRWPVRVVELQRRPWRAELGDAAAGRWRRSRSIPHMRAAARTGDRAGRFVSAGWTYPSINTFFFTSGGAELPETSIKTARFLLEVAGKPDKFK